MSVDSHGGERLGVVIGMNIAITLSQFVGGYLSGSLSLMSDASHNLTDVLSLIVGYLGKKFSMRKPSQKYTFGGGRAEVMTAVINSVSLIILALLIFFEGFSRLVPSEPISLAIMLPVGFVGLFGNVLSVVVLHAERDENLNMKAAYLHLFYDTLSSVFVIISAILIYFTGLQVFDTVASFIIGSMMLWSSYKILKKGVHILMMGAPEGILPEDIAAELRSIEEIEDVHNIHIWSINTNETFLSLHLTLEGEMNCEPDVVLRKARRLLREKFGITSLTIQIENDGVCEDTELVGL